MQVKKFEAKTMKEAIDLVKFHLGPEAIILSARDQKNGLGLKSPGGVEVTAAVSESTLKKKKWAENKLNEETKKKYLQSSAQVQKKFIEKANQLPPEKKIRPLTSTPYIEINETAPESQQIGSPPSVVTQMADQRIRSAVKDAFKAGQATMGKEKKYTSVKSQNLIEVDDLKNEIHYLKSLLENFKHRSETLIHLHPGASEGIPYEMSATFERLQKAGLSYESIVQILKECLTQLGVQQLRKKALIDGWVARHLLEQIQIAPSHLQEKYQVFLGPIGSGKTSTLVKIASHLVIQEKKKIAILSTDYNKVGATEQLRIYAQILNVPFAVIRRPKDWEEVEKRLSRWDALLVDFPGLNLKNFGELNYLKEILPPFVPQRRIHYVQSILSKDRDVFDIAGRYLPLNLQDVIFTGLDETGQHGLIYNFQKKFGLPLHSFGIGPKVPEDWEFATKERVVDLFFKLTKLRKF